MGSLIALDFVLRFICARVMDVAFVVHVFGVHPHDFPPHPASFRIPTYMIANFEILGHGERPGTKNSNLCWAKYANRTMGAAPRSQGQCFLGNLDISRGGMAFRGR
jgi:hypothetical protein